MPSVFVSENLNYFKEKDKFVPEGWWTKWSRQTKEFHDASKSLSARLEKSFQRPT